MGYFKAPDGAYLFDGEQVEIKRDEFNRPVIVLKKNGSTVGVTSLNGQTGDVNISCETLGAMTCDADVATKQSVDDLQTTVQAIDDEIGDCKKNLNEFNTRVGDVEQAISTKLTLSGGTMEGNIDMNDYAVTNLQKLHVDGTTPVYIGSTIESSANGIRLTSTTEGAAAFIQPNTQSTYVPVFAGSPNNINHLATKGYVDSTVDAMKLPAVPSNDKQYLLIAENGEVRWALFTELNWYDNTEGSGS